MSGTARRAREVGPSGPRPRLYAREVPLPAAVVNAFTTRPFGGNPAAVVLLAPGTPADEAWMQSVASQFALSETAFLSSGPNGWGLRWFTPEVEVALCGHATLASAHWLWEQGHAAPGEDLAFATASGTLRAARRGAWIALDLPLRPVEQAEPPDGWRDALPGVEARWVGISAGNAPDAPNALVLTSAAELESLRPDLDAMSSLPLGGWIVTAPAGADAEADVLSRYFAPRAGVDEDPVTGSAHCTLAAYWSERLGRPGFRALQLSRRGGELEVELRAGGRVTLLGRALTVADVELRV